MRFLHIEDRRYACFPRMSAVAGLRHAFSTRPQDMSLRDDDAQARRRAQREQMVRDFGFDPRRLCYCVQVHATRVALIDAPRAGGPLEGVDAVVTDQRQTPLMVFSADCPLILVYDPAAGVLGAAHASWRCTVGQLTARLVQIMGERFGCPAGRLLAGIGPSAGPEQYEVREDVYHAAAGLPQRERLFPRRDGRMYFDLWEANRVLLIAAGLRAENIEVAGICTMSRTDLFYSYRREGAGCGHFCLLAGMPEQGPEGRPAGAERHTGHSRQGQPAISR
jgi:YfiH family protein